MFWPLVTEPVAESSRNSVTNTSLAPASFETYATQRLSGESWASS